MKRIASLTLACAVALALALPALAVDRPDHYQAKQAETVEQALANLHEYNAKLASLMEKESLTPEELNQVHLLTYTLENALEKLRDEHEKLAEVLEEVHQASESADADEVQRSGRDYLERVQKLIP
jgi:DNA repair ATPase RecN